MHSTSAGNRESSGDTVIRRMVMEMRLAMMSDVERFTNGVGDVNTAVTIAASVACLCVGSGESCPAASDSTRRVGMPYRY